MLFGGGTDFQSHRDHREHREGFPNAFLCELGVLCGFSHFTALISIIGIIEVTARRQLFEFARHFWRANGLSRA